ncbi:tyrosine-type recombinase/integrase [Sulfitobacter sp. 1A16787]|uniref:tyrosine-type recombinase/integrase n=1 Tax=Sulfitobacter sp. 1A16787 TaxID=3368571 RepID=UPI0037473DD4
MLKKFRRTKGKNYYIRGTVAGCNIYESTGTSNAAQAEQYRLRREREIITRHTQGRAATLTFAEAALAYLESGGESRFLAPLLHHFGPDTLAADIDNAAANSAAAALYPDAAPGTINRQVITPLSAVLHYIADDTGTPARRLRRRKGDKARLRWITPEEAERLLDCAAPHLLPVLGFLLGGGCRTSEALQITPQLYYPRTGEAYLPETKNGHPRMIQLPPRARDLVQSRPWAEVGPICRTPKGAAYVIRENGGGQVSGAFRKACTAAGLGADVTPHTLRHTWATWFYAQTKDFGRLLDLGGWQKADMAMRYRKAAPADLGARLWAHGWDFSQDAQAPQGQGAQRFRVVRGD